MRKLRVAFRMIVLAACFPASFLSAQGGPAGDPAFKEQFERGGKALKEGKYKDAIDALKKANKLRNNSCGECYLLLAVAYCHSGELGQCEENCDKAAAAASDDLMRAKVHHLKGNALFSAAGTDGKKMKASEGEFRSAVQLDPKNAVFHLSLANASLRQSKDDDAKPELETFLGLNTDEALARQARLILADPRRGRARSSDQDSKSARCRVREFR
jgi:tetratricopeptide (TPR) repeat protein